MISRWSHRYALLSYYAVYFEAFSRCGQEVPRDVKMTIVGDLHPGDVVIIRKFPPVSGLSPPPQCFEGIVLANSETSGLTNLYILADDQVILKTCPVMESVLIRKMSQDDLISTAKSRKPV